MFDEFEKAFLSDGNKAENEGASLKTSLPNDYLNILYQRYGGMSFNLGIYRIFSSSDTEHWNSLISDTFPDFAERITCFATDWLGRVFAIDSDRIENGLPGILMFEPGTAEVLEIPCNIKTFHEDELIHYQEEALAKDFHQQWLSLGGQIPNTKQCIGYKIPLFLGGSDNPDNLILSDIDVYWTVASQLIKKSRGYAVGSSVGKVVIN